jgi:hypothetical protein
MSLLRCPRCGEIADNRKDARCPGCGMPVPAPNEDEEYAKRLQVAAAQQEAGRDVKASTIVLLVIGVLVLGVLLRIDLAWTLIGAVVLAVALGASAAAGVIDVVLRVIAIIAIGGVVLVVGLFVFFWIVCLSSDVHWGG